MKKVSCILIFICMLLDNLFCQQIVVGPVVGALTDTSAKILFLTNEINFTFSVIEDDKNNIVYGVDFLKIFNENQQNSVLKKGIIFDASIYPDNLKPNTPLALVNIT